MRLVDALFLLDSDRLEALAARHSVELDDRKRITRAEQVARGIADLPQRYDLAGLSDAEKVALAALAARPRGLPRHEIGGAALALVRADLAFVDDGDRVFVPGAFRVALPPSADDPVPAARLLLAEIDDDLVHALSGRHTLRRVLPRTLVLDEVLGSVGVRGRGRAARRQRDPGGVATASCDRDTWWARAHRRASDPRARARALLHLDLLRASQAWTFPSEFGA